MSFFPAIERSGEIKFYLLKSLPYYPRIGLILVFFGLGLALQVSMMTVFPGVLFVTAAVALGLASGFQSKTEIAGSPFWKEVAWDAYEEIIKVNERNARWDRTLLDVTNTRGGILFACVILQAVVVWLLLLPRPSGSAAGTIYLVDVLVAAVPLWATGARRLLKNDQLVIQAEELLRIRDGFADTVEGNGDRLAAMLETRSTESGDGEVPSNMQLKVAFKDMPKSLYGLQAQVNINEVQGTSYPYFYCVIVGEKGLALQRFQDRIQFVEPAPKPEAELSWVEKWVQRLGLGGEPPIIVEYQQQRDVEVLVIRQQTTKQSGYHVKPERAREIFRSSYQLGRDINASLLSKRQRR